MNTALYVDKNKPCEECVGTGLGWDPAEIRFRITRYLKQSNTSQNQLAKKLGVSWSYLSVLMNGIKPWNRGMVEKVAAIIEHPE